MMKEGFIVLFFVCNPKTLFFLFSFFFLPFMVQSMYFFFPSSSLSSFYLKNMKPTCMYV